MGHVVKASDLTEISLNETDTAASVLQNIALLLVTPKGSVPFYRDYGVPFELLHRPINVAKALLTAEITRGILKYEPRATVSGITYTADADEPDRLCPEVEVEIDGA